MKSPRRHTYLLRALVGGALLCGSGAPVVAADSVISAVSRDLIQIIANYWVCGTSYC